MEIAGAKSTEGPPSPLHALASSSSLQVYFPSSHPITDTTTNVEANTLCDILQCSLLALQLYDPSGAPLPLLH